MRQATCSLPLTLGERVGTELFTDSCCGRCIFWGAVLSRFAMDWIRYFTVRGMAFGWGCATSCRTGKIGRSRFLYSRTNGGCHDSLLRRHSNSLLQLDDSPRGDPGLVGVAAMWLEPQRSVRNGFGFGGGTGGQVDGYSFLVATLLGLSLFKKIMDGDPAGLTGLGRP